MRILKQIPETEISDAIIAADLAKQYAGVGAHFLGYLRAVAPEKVCERVDGTARGRYGRADLALPRGSWAGARLCL